MRLNDTRWRATVLAFKSVPKSTRALARIHAFEPVSATRSAPSWVDGPAVSATAPLMAPVPSALDAPPRNTSMREMSSGSTGRSIRWWPVWGALQRTPSTHNAVCSNVPPRTLRSVVMPTAPRERTSMPGTVSNTSATEGAPVSAISWASSTTKARGAASGVTVKPPVTAAGLNAVVSTAMLPVSVWANAMDWTENKAMNVAKEREKCFINSESKAGVFRRIWGQT